MGITQNPKVTVLMPVFNGEFYLAEAIRSILRQTFTDFEFLILNDGSTDNSVAIIEAFADPRIRLVNSDSNRGLVSTLNDGLGLARGEYIARMDCDDISLPQRLHKQVAFMDNHPEIDVSGAWYREFGGKFGVITRCALEHDTISCGTLFNPVIGHPSVILRKRALVNSGLCYDPVYKHAEDYELWARAQKYFKFANLGEILLLYRVHQGQITQTQFNQQMESAGRVRLSLLRDLGIEPTAEEFEIHQTLSSLTRPYLCEFNNTPAKIRLRKIDRWLCKLKFANDANHVYPQSIFSRILVERWLGACFLLFFARGQWPFNLLIVPQILKQSDQGWKYAFRFILKHLFICIADFRYLKLYVRYSDKK